jgi:hypothetical protein
MLGAVDLSGLNFVRDKSILAESLGQRFLGTFTALSPFYVEQPHDKVSALYKCPTIRCKNNLERSTAPISVKIYAQPS